MTNVNVVIGAGLIGQTIARRVSTGKHVLLADLHQENADAAAKVLSDAGFTVSAAVVDISSRTSVHSLVKTSMAIGTISGVIHAAGVSPTQASPATILKVDLYGTALVLEEFGNVIAQGGAGVWRYGACAAARRAACSAGYSAPWCCAAWSRCSCTGFRCCRSATRHGWRC